MVSFASVLVPALLATCPLDPASAVFTAPTGGLLEPGPSPVCLYHAHRLEAAAGALAVPVASLSIQPAPREIPQVQAFSLLADVARPGLFRAAALRAEYHPTDLPAGFVASDMRLFVECPGPVDAEPRPWCMPETDPEADVAAGTVSASVADLPRYVAALVRTSTLTAPADWTFTRSTPIEVRGRLLPYDVNLARPVQFFTGWGVELEVGADRYAPAPDLRSGEWIEPRVALVENENRVTARGHDPSGDRSFERRTVVLDTIPPVVTLGGVAAGAVLRGPVILALEEVERWPDTRTLTGSRLLVAFEGEPEEREALRPALAKRSESPRVFEAAALARDGEHALTATATDRAGNTGAASLAFAIDTVPPRIALGGVVPESYHRIGVHVTARITDRHLRSVAFPHCVDADPDPRIFACTAAITAEGRHELTATADDAAGNATTSVPLVVTIDRTRPAVSFTGIAEGEQRAAPFAVSVAIADANRDPAAESARLERDGALIEERPPASPFAIADPGHYTLTVTATDRAGNTRLATRSFALDLADPTLAIEFPKDGAWLRAPSTPVRGSYADADLASLALDPGSVAASFEGGRWSADGFPLVEGANAIVATATDRAGRAATSSITVSLDTTPPVVRLGLLPALTREQPLAVTGTATDLHLAEVRLQGQLTTSPVNGTVTLAEGLNEVALEATDRAGNSARAAVSVTLDSRVDLLVVSAPGDGHATAADTIVFSGAARDVHGVTLRLAGAPVALDQDGRFRATVALAPGFNAIEAVATDGAGNVLGTTTRITRDVEPPRFVASTPADGTKDLPLAQAIALRFTEEVVIPPGELTLVPAPAWPSDSEILVKLTARITDTVGNPLANPATLRFHTVDRTGPAAVLLDPLPASTRLPSIKACGETSADTTFVRIEGALHPIDAESDAGRFCADLPLEPNALNQLVFTPRDAASNPGRPAVAYVRQETVAPAVLSARLAGSDLAIAFTREMDCSSVNASSVLLQSGTTPIDRSVACHGDTATVTSATADLASAAFLLTVTTDAKDRTGQPLAFRFQKLFNLGDGFFTGEVYDARTGWRLPGASVEDATSDGDGAFRVAITDNSTRWLRASKPGHVDVWRQATGTLQFVIPVFDFRLMPRSTERLELPGGGGTIRSNGVLLTVPAGVPAGTLATLTPLPAQALPALLPLGWRPLGSVEVHTGAPLAFSPPASLRVAAGSQATLVRHDETTHAWLVLPPPSLAADGKSLIGSIPSTGTYAFVVPDQLPGPPPPAIVGDPLPGLPPLDAAVASPLTASLALAPAAILPTGESTASLALADPLLTTSGLALQADVAERFTRLGGGDEVASLPFTADLTAFQSGAELPLRPSERLAAEAIESGVVHLELREFPDSLPAGKVITRAASNLDDGLWYLAWPADAVAEPTPVTLARAEASTLAPPAGMTLIAALDLGFGGGHLYKGASLALRSTGHSPADRFVLLREGSFLGSAGWVLVADASFDGARIATGSIGPLVREAGLHAFFRVDAPSAFGYVTGTVGPQGAGARISSSLEAIAIATDEADFAVMAAAGDVDVAGESASTRDTGLVRTNVVDRQAAIVDLKLAPVPPRVVAATLTSGDQGILLTFSEAVDPASLAGGVAVQGHPGTTLALRGATQALFDPDADFPPDATLELSAGPPVRDQAGHPLEPYGPVTFRTRDTRPPAPAAPGAVQVWAPDAGGLVCVEAPRPPDVVAVTATNLKTGASAGLTCLGGACRGCLRAARGEVVRVAFLDDAGNIVVEDHDLFLERGTSVPTVEVGKAGGRFVAADADGVVEASIPAGAFDQPVRLSIDPTPIDLTDADAEAFTVASSFTLALDGREAAKDLELRLDSTGFDPAREEAILVRWVEWQGKRHPEFVAQLALVDGKLATRLPALTLDTSPALKSRTTSATSNPLPTERVPGVRREGSFAQFRTNALGMAYFATLAAAGGFIGAVAGLEAFADFVYVAYDLDDYPMVFVVKPGVDFTFEMFDPATGTRRFSRTYPPIAPNHGTWDTTDGNEERPLWVVAARPMRTHRFQLVNPIETVAKGITLSATPDWKVTLHGDKGSVAPGARVRLLGVEATADAEGSFDLGGPDGIPAAQGDTLLVAIETREVDPLSPVVIELNRPVEDLTVKLDGSDVPFAADGRAITLQPAHRLESGKSYEVRVSHPKMAQDFIGRFTTTALVATGSVRLDDANDQVRVGSIVFVAAGKAGLRVLDASFPDKLVQVGSGAPTIGSARGVTAFRDAAGALRVALVGGGDAEPGFLRLYEVTDWSAPALFAGEVLASRLGSREEERYENLGDGVPLRVRALTTTYGASTRTYAYAAVLGLGLEVIDVAALTAAPTMPPRRPAAIVGLYPADDLRDVAVLPRKRAVGETVAATFHVVGPSKHILPKVAYQQAGGRMVLLGEPGAVPGGAAVRVHDRTNGASRAARARDDGSFVIGEGDALVVDEVHELDYLVTHEEAQVLGVVARSALGIDVLDLGAPGFPRQFGRLHLAGEVRAVRVFPGFPLERGPVDLAFAITKAEGIVVVDLTDEKNPRRIGRIAISAAAFDIAFDSAGLRAVVNLGSDGLALIDLAEPTREGEPTDSRVLARFASAGGMYNTGLVADFDTGYVWASAQGEGVMAFRLALPGPRFVTGETEWSEVIPKGIPGVAGRPDSSEVHVALTLPGGVGEEVHVAIEPLTAYGAPQRDPAWPGIRHRVDRLTLARRSHDKLSDDHNLYVSLFPLALTADPALVSTTPGAIDLAAGDLLRASYAEVSATIRSWRMDLVPGDAPAPAIGASTGTGDVLGVYLHSGEFSWSETDLALAGRVLPVAVARHHLSRIRHSGPFGKSWDSPLFARVMALPSGDLWYYDGAGARWGFQKLDPPEGVPVLARSKPLGHELVTPSGLVASFNLEGDLESTTDTWGNRIELLRDAAGRLSGIRDDLGRVTRLEWNAEERVAAVVDFGGRRVEYGYDGARLTSRTRFGMYATGYGYHGDAVRSIRNERGDIWLDNTYDTLGRVATQQWGGPADLVRIAYPSASKTVVTDRNGHVTEYTHKQKGRIWKVLEKNLPADSETVTDYDAQGRLASLVGPEGEAVLFTYADSASPLRRGLVVEERYVPRPGSGEAAESVRRAFGSSGDVVSETDRRGTTTTFDRGLHRELVRVVRPRGLVTTYEYNERGQLVRERAAAGAPAELVTEHAYAEDASWHAVTVDPGGLKLTTRTQHDLYLRPSRVIDPGGTVTLLEYDPRDLLVRETRDEGGFNYVTRWEHDVRGLLTRTTRDDLVVVEERPDVLGFVSKRAVGGMTGGISTLFEPDATRQVAKVTHPLGWAETFVRDARDQVTKVVRAGGAFADETLASYDRAGAVLTATDAVGSTTSSEYDGHGRLKKTISPRGLWVERAYHPGGLLREERATRPPGPGETDRQTLRLVALEYDDLGYLRSRAEGPDPQGTESFVTDLLGRVLTRTDRRRKPWTAEYFRTGWLRAATDPLGNRTEYTYTRRGEVATLASEGRTWLREHDALGRETAQVDPAGHRTARAHDAFDRVTSVTDALGHATTYTYDVLGRLLVEEGPEGEKVTRTWDAGGGLASYTDARGNTTVYTPDALGRTSVESRPGLGSTSWTHTAADQVETATTPRGFVLTMGYDPDGNLETRTVTKDAQPVETETYGHDLLGRMTSAENATARIERELDSFGGVKTERVALRDGSGLVRTLRRSFDAGLLLASLTYPGGRALGYVPDDLGRIDRITQGASVVADYDHEGAARIRSRTTLGTLVASFAYRHDEPLLRHTATRAAGVRLGESTVAWTPRHELGEVAALTAGGRRTVVDYDKAGRMTSLALGVPPGQPVAGATRRTSFTFDAVRNWKQIEDALGGAYRRRLAAEPTTGNRYAKLDGVDLSYDEEGNLIDDGHGRTFTWDWAGRLASVSGVAFAHDALGRKVRREAGGDVRYLWYDDDHLIEETDVLGAIQREVIYGAGTDEPLVYFGADGAPRRFIFDRAGNVAGIVDAADKLREAYTYVGGYGRLQRHGAERVAQARFESDTLVLRATGELDPTSTSAITLTPKPAGAWTPSADGRELHLTPPDDDKDGRPDWPASSVAVSVATTLRASTGIELAESRAFTFDPREKSARILEDWLDPAVEQVAQDQDGSIVVRFSEPMSSSTVAGAFKLTERGPPASDIPLVATLSTDGLTATLTPSASLTPGEPYELSVLSDKLADLAAKKLASSTWSWTADDSPLRIADQSDTPPAQASLIGNQWFFQSRPLDPATGLLDFRHRHLDPTLSRWLSPDPLGHPDGPNAYAAFLADPVNNRDPQGTVAVGDNLAGGLVGVGLGWGVSHLRGQDYTLKDAGVDFALGFASSGIASIAMASKAGFAARAGLLVAGEGAIAALTAGAHAGIHDQSVTFADLSQAGTASLGVLAFGRPGGAGLSSVGRGIAGRLDEMAAEASHFSYLGAAGGAIQGGTGRAWRALRGPRYMAGVATGGKSLPEITGQWLRGTHGSAGVIPKQIADRLRGRAFRDFDEFRAAFWTEVAGDSDLSRQFASSDMGRMRSGYAPRAPKEQRVGGQKSYVLHHRSPIGVGGNVFDLDNLSVVSPRYHMDILDRVIHFVGAR